MNKDAYLARIGVLPDDLEVNEEILKLLQLKHLLTVPFENLDIHLRRPIALDLDKLYGKIVIDQRGGFCYELNGLFNWLLQQLGYRTRLVSARVFDGSEFGPEFDHAAVIVTIGEIEYLADVGFGDFATAPLFVLPDVEQQDREGMFILRRAAEVGVLEVAKRVDGEQIPQYQFSLLGRDLSEFAEMCDFQQYSPESHFTKGKVCSILTENGRKTLTDKKFIISSDGHKTETEVGSVIEFNRILQREFQIAASVDL